MTIRVVVVEDEHVVREGLLALLSTQADFEVVGSASDGLAAVAEVDHHRPDVVLMDLRMPGGGGVAATRAICADRLDDLPAAKVLILTTFHGDDEVIDSLRAGATGYLLKQTVSTDLFTAIRRIHEGAAWIDPLVATQVIAALADRPRTGPGLVELRDRLTRRELEVLMLMAEGFASTQIADRLVIGAGTVKTHVSRILMKTGSRDRAQAVATAYRIGLVRPPRAASPRPGPTTESADR